MKCSILAIGDELLFGQIINRNAAQISALLLDFGIRVVEHLVVGDENAKILDGLKYVSRESEIIFITGGLGPTEDDLTRQAFADFVGEKLELDEQALKDLQHKLTQRGVRLTKNYSQQAMFPENSERMVNGYGSADGFYYSKKQKHYFILPGPWVEIITMWDAFIINKLHEIYPQGAPVAIEKWQMLGVAESELSEAVLEILQGSPFQAGYRFHPPYVELKVDLKNQSAASFAPYKKKIEDKYQQNLFVRGNGDVALTFLQKTMQRPIYILDTLSDGYMYERLQEFYAKVPEHQCTYILSKHVDEISFASDAQVIRFEKTTNGFQVQLQNMNSQNFLLEKISSYKTNESRLRKELTEIFFLKMSEKL